MKRVLVLHGHTENAHVFGRKFNDIRDALKDDVEFGQSPSCCCTRASCELIMFTCFAVFIDAPHLLTPVDPQGEPVFSTSAQFTKIKNLDPKQPTKHTPRGWFYHTHTAEDAWAVSQTLMYLRGILEKEGPFHVSIGDLMS